MVCFYKICKRMFLRSAKFDPLYYHISPPSSRLHSREDGEAEQLHERSQAIGEKVLGAEHPDVAQSLKHRAGRDY